MAVYTPVPIVPVVALTSTPGTSVLTGTGGTTYVCRTIHFSSSALKAVTLSFGADAAGKRLFDAVAVAANIPAIYNGLWPVAGSAAHDIDASVNSTTAQLYIGGYTYA